MKKLTLYNGPNSPFGRKTKVTAIVLEIPIEEKIVKIQEAEFVDNFNPLRKIPTLVIDNNQTIIDSDNICLYFDKISNKETTLYTRGRYLVKVLGHCGECHTPRNIFGATNRENFLRGSLDQTGNLIPDLTPHNTSSIKNWKISQLIEYLDSGMLPNGDFAGSKMAEVIEFSTSRMSYLDRNSIATYLKQNFDD